MNRYTATFLTLLLGLVLVPDVLHAQIQSGVLDTQVNALGDATGLEGATDPRIIIASIVQVALGLVGTLFMILIVFSGYWLLIARGREEYIDRAKKTVVRALVGMMIVLLAYGITTFVKNSIQYVS